MKRYRKTGDWFFEGYQAELVPKKHGRGQKRKLVYAGNYYQFALNRSQLFHLKLRLTAYLLAALICYLLMTLSVYLCSSMFYVGIPTLIALIPLIYLCMGTVCLWMAKPAMTVGQTYGSVRRIKRAVCAALGFLSLSLVGDLVFLMVYAGHYPLGQELRFAIGNGSALLFLSLIWSELLRHPVSEVSKDAPSQEGNPIRH